MRPNEYEESRTTTSVSVNANLLKRVKEQNINLSRLLDRAMSEVLGEDAPKEIYHLTPEERKKQRIHDTFQSMPEEEQTFIKERVLENKAMPFCIKLFRRDYGVRVLPKDLIDYVKKEHEKEEKRIKELLNEKQRKA